MDNCSVHMETLKRAQKENVRRKGWRYAWETKYVQFGNGLTSYIECYMACLVVKKTHTHTHTHIYIYSM
jgi:hypothetical protein